jgi:cysteine synthase A
MTIALLDRLGQTGLGQLDEAIGATPLARVRRVVGPDSAELWIKLEGQNPGGSIKDRTALGMIADAERRGLLRPGTVIVEPTSGNTGIGLAQLASARGYRLILTLPSSMSEERKRTLAGYGAELVLTDPERRMLAAIEEAERLRDQLDAWMPNQFSNPANVAIHYATTGPELWSQMGGRIDAFVYGSGTGGTISGVGRFLKEHDPRIRVIAVEPARSPVLSGGERGQHQFQGMGPGFVPANFDRSVVDEIRTVWEEDAFPFARRLMREEGLFLGMSSGGIGWVAAQVARELGPNARVAMISPDSAARYLSTVLFDDPTSPPR